MAIHFTYVRHGETLFNKTARMQGQCDSPLSQKGIAQAENTASALRAEHFDHIFCSSSERAWDTAKIIAAYHREKPVLLKELKEFDFGRLDGELFSDMNDIIQKHRKADEWTDVGGENVPLFEKRATAAFKKILSKCREEEHVLIVSHGSYFSHLLKTLIAYDFDDYRRRMDAAGRPLVPNCSISEFVYENGVYKLVSEPQTADEYRASQKKNIRLVITCTNETVFEAEGRKEGQSDSPLTDAGVMKTEETAAELRSYDFDGAFVSTSERARDTAAILLKEREVYTLYLKDLRERYLGLLEADNKIKEEEITDYAQYHAESEEELEARAEKIVRTIYDYASSNQTYLVVTHRMFCEKLISAIDRAQNIFAQNVSRIRIG